MHVSFTPELEARIAELAQVEGTSAEQLILSTMMDRLRDDDLLRALETDADYQAAVWRGIEAADRGELIEHSEVMANLQTLTQS